MSSRSSYLSADERAQATVLREALELGRSLYEAGETDAARVASEMRSLIESKPSAEVQYVAAVDWRTLDDVTVLGPGTMLALAVFVGRTRLIDNVVLGEREGSTDG